MVDSQIAIATKREERGRPGYVGLESGDRTAACALEPDSPGQRRQQRQALILHRPKSQWSAQRLEHPCGNLRAAGSGRSRQRDGALLELVQRPGIRAKCLE